MEEIKPRVDSMGRKTYGVEERERLMAECEASGKSRKEFAQERGINYSTLIDWHTKSGRRWRRPSKLAEGGITLKKLDTKTLFSGRGMGGDAIAEISHGDVSVRLYREISGPFLEELLGLLKTER